MKKILTLIIVFCTIFSLNAAEEKESGPYSTDWLTDGLILGSGALLFGSNLLVRHYNPQTPASEADSSLLILDDVNGFDRWSASPYNESLDISSDIVLGTLFLMPALLGINNNIKDIGIIALMYGEAMIVSHSLKELVKGSVTRYRPYNYFDDPHEDFSNTDSADSFYSGHASFAFTSAAFFTTVFEEYHSDSNLKYLVGGGSFGLAALVAGLRIGSGNHYFSDVLVGAATGSLIGWLIPFLHKNRDEDLPEIALYSTGENGLAMSLTHRY